MKRIVFFAAIIGWVGLLPLQALSDAGSSSATKEEKVQIARAAAPSFISDNATIVDVDGSVLIEGDNGWTCSPGTQSDFLDPPHPQPLAPPPPSTPCAPPSPHPGPSCPG